MLVADWPLFQIDLTALVIRKGDDSEDDDGDRTRWIEY